MKKELGIILGSMLVGGAAIAMNGAGCVVTTSCRPDLGDYCPGVACGCGTIVTPGCSTCASVVTPGCSSVVVTSCSTSCGTLTGP